MAWSSDRGAPAQPGWHALALEMGCTARRSGYDALYVAFAVATGADKVVAADGPFIRNMRGHPDALAAGMPLSLHAWGAGRGLRG